MTTGTDPHVFALEQRLALLEDMLNGYTQQGIDTLLQTRGFTFGKQAVRLDNFGIQVASMGSIGQPAEYWSSAFFAGSTPPAQPGVVISGGVDASNDVAYLVKAENDISGAVNNTPPITSTLSLSRTPTSVTALLNANYNTTLQATLTAFANATQSYVSVDTVFWLGVLTADPTVLSDGMMWYRSDTKQLKYRGNGVTVVIDDGTGTILKSIGTTKGDIIVWTGANTPVRQGVGADRTSLVADSLQANGIAWKQVPLVVTSDPTPNAGEQWYRSDIFQPKISVDGVTGALPWVIGAPVLLFVTTTNAEQTVFSVSVPGGLLLNSAANAVHFQASGQYLQNGVANDTFRLRAKYGGTTYWDSTTGNIAQNAAYRPWRLWGTLSSNGATNAQILDGHFTLGSTAAPTTGRGALGTNDTIDVSWTGAPAQDSTVAKTLTFTFQMTTSNANIQLSVDSAIMWVG